MCTNVDDKGFNVDDKDFQSEAGLCFYVGPQYLETWQIVQQSTIFDVFSKGTRDFDEHPLFSAHCDPPTKQRCINCV